MAILLTWIAISDEYNMVRLPSSVILALVNKYGSQLVYTALSEKNKSTREETSVDVQKKSD